MADSYQGSSNRGVEDLIPPLSTSNEMQAPACKPPTERKPKTRVDFCQARSMPVDELQVESIKPVCTDSGTNEDNNASFAND